MRSDQRLRLALAVTGIAALALEVIWSRALIPWVGGTAMAQVMTVAMYMFGLFVGAALGTLTVTKKRTPRRDFLKVEAAAAIWSGLAIFALPALSPVFSWFSQGALLSSDGGAALRGIAGGTLILPATIMMGWAFPMAIAALQQSAVGRDAAALAYGINTLGATAGTCLGGFVLVPALGVKMGTVVIVIADLLVLLWASRGPFATLGRDLATPNEAQGTDSSASSAWLAELPMLIAVTVGGVIALALEVLLFRILGMVLGPTARAFTVVLASYVFGLGLGALAVKAWVGKGVLPAKRVFVGCWVVVGIAGFLLYWCIGSWPELLIPSRDSLEAKLAVQLGRRAWVAALTLVPLTFAFGASYAAAVAAGQEGDAKRAGRLYAALTMGNIAGLIVAAIAILPKFGIDRGAQMLFAISFLVPLPILLRKGWLSSRTISVAIGLVICAGLTVALRKDWDWKLLNSAPYLQKQRHEGSPFRYLLFFEPGFETTVAVEKKGDDRLFSLDGKTDGSTSFMDQTTQSYVGLLPTLLHPNPKNALVIGLGTGQTSANILKFALERVDCAELSGSVVKALSFFEDINDRVWEDPRFHVLKTDGRTVLRYGSEQYDLVVSEPSNVWVPGVAHLFTRETFEEARNRLDDENGILLQWLHAYSLDPDAFRSVTRTLLEVFPHVTLWSTSMLIEEALFVSSMKPLKVSFADLDKKLKERNLPNFMAPGQTLTAVSVLRNYVAGTEALRRFAGKGPLTSDSRPSLEYAAEISMYEETGYRFHEMVANLVESAEVLLVEPNQDHAEILGRRAQANEAVHRLLARKDVEPDPNIFKALADKFDDDPEVRFALAEILTDGAKPMLNSNPMLAEDLLQTALSFWPSHKLAIQRLMGLAQKSGDFPRAQRLLRRLESAYGGKGVFPIIVRGDLNWIKGNLAGAERAYLEALAKDPLSLNAAVQLARFYSVSRKKKAARTYFEMALEMDPGNKIALEGLKELSD